MKTYILAAHCNNLHYIDFQYQSIKKHFKGEYEFIILNDAKEYGDSTNFGDSSIRKGIEEKCQSLGIHCMNVPQNLHTMRYVYYPGTEAPSSNSPSSRNAIAIQYGFNQYATINDGYLMILDSDMFFYEDIELDSIMNGYDIAGSVHWREDGNRRVDYLWIAMCIFNLKTCPFLHELKWECGLVDGIRTDTGGWTYHYLQQYKPRVRNMIWNRYNDIESYKNGSIHPSIDKFFDAIIQIQPDSGCTAEPFSKELFPEINLLHLRCGSNWDNKGTSYHVKQYHIINEQFFSN
jgi:hypothetical protein